MSIEIPMWSLELVKGLLSSVASLLSAKSQDDIDDAYMNAAEHMARAKIARESGGSK